MYRIEVFTSPLMDVVNSNIRFLRQENLEASELPRKVTVSVPASVLDRQLPAISQDFNRKHRQHQRQRKAIGK